MSGRVGGDPEGGLEQGQVKDEEGDIGMKREESAMAFIFLTPVWDAM